MKDWDKLSDRIIDRLILVSLYGDGDKDIEKSWRRGNFNYCNSWADMGPIIERERLDIEASLTCDEWLCCKLDEDGFFIVAESHKNPLRAAAIVYLEMNGVKP